MKITNCAVVALSAALSLAPAFSASATTIDTSGTYPAFVNPTVDALGADAVVNDTIEYDSVLTADGVTVDALITVLSVDGDVTAIDGTYGDTTSPWPEIFSWLSFQADPDGGGSVRYRIDFFDHDTDAPVELSGLTATVKDIDENQYFQTNHVDTYLLSTTPASEISVLLNSDDSSIPSDEVRFDSPPNAQSSTDEDYWATVKFETTDSIIIELGQGDYDWDESAWYVVDFAPIDWTVEPTESNPTDGGGSGGGDSGGNQERNLASTGPAETLGVLGATGSLAALAGIALLSRRAQNRKSL